jgi:hypothetical protein
MDVVVFQLGKNEHRHLTLAVEDRPELAVGVDHPAVLGVLQPVGLYVVPDLLGDLGAGLRRAADHRSQRGIRLNGALQGIGLRIGHVVSF